MRTALRTRGGPFDSRLRLGDGKCCRRVGFSDGYTGGHVGVRVGLADNMR
jgi:hypothetical protein